MGRLVILRGLPGSGKSTLAKKMAEAGKTMRVNRDDIRRMLGGEWSGKREKVVIDIEKQAVRTALAHGHDVVIDDTNLGYPERGPWSKFTTLNLDKTEVIDLTGVSLDLCVQRDGFRKTKENGRVGRAIINRMAAENGLIDWSHTARAENITQWVIVDIDGTVADLDHRLHTIATPGQKDFREFHARVKDDKPLTVVIEWVQALYGEGMGIIFVSGRGDECAIATEDWLMQHCPKYDFLFMRRGGDYRPDQDVKRDIYNMLPKDKIAFAIDDRPRICTLWRELGVKVFPVHQDRWVGRE